VLEQPAWATAAARLRPFEGVILSVTILHHVFACSAELCCGRTLQLPRIVSETEW